MYIVIEGQDGTGKSTQAELLKKHYEEQGKEVLMLEEPDGDLPQAHDLHDMILTRGYDLEPLTNVLPRGQKLISKGLSLSEFDSRFKEMGSD